MEFFLVSIITVYVIYFIGELRSIFGWKAKGLPAAEPQTAEEPQAALEQAEEPQAEEPAEEQAEEPAEEPAIEVNSLEPQAAVEQAAEPAVEAEAEEPQAVEEFTLQETLEEVFQVAFEEALKAPEAAVVGADEGVQQVAEPAAEPQKAHKWAECYVRTGVWPSNALQRLAIKAANAFPLRPRSEGEAIARILACYRSAKAGVGRHAWKQLEKVAASQLMPGKYGDYAGGRAVFSYKETAEEYAVMGAIYRLTGKISWFQAKWIVAYIKASKQGVAYLEGTRLWDLLAVARAFDTRKNAYEHTAYRMPANLDVVPLKVLVRLARMASTTKLVRWAAMAGARQFWNEETRTFDREAFWLFVRKVSNKRVALTQEKLPMTFVLGSVFQGFGGNHRLLWTVKYNFRKLPHAKRVRAIREFSWATFKKVMEIGLWEGERPSAEKESSFAETALALANFFGKRAIVLIEAYGLDLEKAVKATNLLSLTLNVPAEERQELVEFLLRHKGNEGLDDHKVRIVLNKWAVLTPKAKAFVLKNGLEGATTLYSMMGYSHELPADEHFDFYLAVSKVKGAGLMSAADKKAAAIRWYASLETPRAFSGQKVYTHDGWTGRFIARKDIRGLFLGNHTDCCQHPMGAGAGCAWHGQESPNGGFFIWENSKGIQAQSWVWVSPEGAVCFDNIEALSRGSKDLNEGDKKILAILNMVAKDLGCRVYLGKGYSQKFANEYADASGRPVHPADYSGYRDSLKQVVVAEGTTPYRPGQGIGVRSHVRMGCVEDLQGLKKVAEAVYPNGWQFVSYETGDQVVVFNNLGGYAVLDPQAQEIKDLAILPEHRRTPDRVELMEALVCLMQERSAISRNVVWTAEARESTSLPMLRRLAQQGLIELMELEPTTFMNGEPLVPVRIVFLSQKGENHA